MPGKKKTVKNALYFYMRELQQEMREGGTTLPLNEIAPIACPKFKELPFEAKQRYEEMAKEERILRKEYNVGKLTSHGVPIALIEAEAEEAERIKKEEIARVHSFVDKNIASITNVSIYIVSFNILVATRDNQFLPNEVGIVEYSLREGMKSSHHAFINPGRVPVGYFSEAKKHSEEFHNLPVMMEEFEGIVEDNYNKILEDIVKFTKSERGPRIIFSHESQLEQTEGAFRWLMERAPGVDVKNISFANISILLVKLFSITDHKLQTRVLADDLLSQNTFDYALNSRCNFHEDLDSCYCALSFARRMCFILSDALVKIFGLELTSSHLPTRDSFFMTNEAMEVLNVPQFLEIKSQPLIPMKEKEKNSEQFCDSDNDDFFETELVGATAAKEIKPEKEILTIPDEVLLPSFRCTNTKGGLGRGRGLYLYHNKY